MIRRPSPSSPEATPSTRPTVPAQVPQSRGSRVRLPPRTRPGLEARIRHRTGQRFHRLRHRGHLDLPPDPVGQRVLPHPFRLWEGGLRERGRSPAVASRVSGDDMVPIAQGSGRREPHMLTTGLSLRFDPIYGGDLTPPQGHSEGLLATRSTTVLGWSAMSVATGRPRDSRLPQPLYDPPAGWAPARAGPCPTCGLWTRQGRF